MQSASEQFMRPVKREMEDGELGARALVVCTPCVTDPTLPLPAAPLAPHAPHATPSPPSPHRTPPRHTRTADLSTPDSGRARGRLRNALIADSDDFAPIMGGGRFQLQTEDQESEPLELEPFLALEPPMSATDYGFCLDHDEGLSELFDFEF